MTALNLYTECEDPEEIIEAFKKFAEYHVEKALKAAEAKVYENIEGHDWDIPNNTFREAYPLENIK